MAISTLRPSSSGSKERSNQDQPAGAELPDPFDSFQLPFELRKLLSEWEQQSLKDEILEIIRLKKRDPELEDNRSRGYHLWLVFDAIAIRLQHQPNFKEDLVPNVIPDSIEKIRSDLSWYPHNHGDLRPYFLAPSITQWRNASRRLVDDDRAVARRSRNPDDPSSRHVQMRSQAWARFVALRNFPPGTWDEPAGSNFNEILLALQEAFGEDLSVFRIPDDQMEAMPLYVQRRPSTGRPVPRIPMSNRRLCDPQFALQQVNGAYLYLEPIGRGLEVPKGPREGALAERNPGHRNGGSIALSQRFEVGHGPTTSHMETFLNAHHPKFMYHPTKPSVQVFSRKEIDELGPEWSETYVYQEYPKCKYHWSGKTATVKNRDEELALGGGWSSLPGAFDPYKEPALVRPKDPNPLKWIDRWPPTLQSSESRRKLMAALLKAHAAFWKSPEYPSATVDSMQQAFNGIAQVLLDAGLLTESILQTDLPGLVWDSAVSGGWWHLASETPNDIFPQKKGHYWVWLDDKRDWPALFRGETAEWIAKPLESTQDTSAANARNSQDLWKFQAPTANPTEIFECREGARLESGGSVGSPEDRLQSFIQQHPGTTYADVKYSAQVHTAEFQDWRRGELSTRSVMSARIEDVLRERRP